MWTTVALLAALGLPPAPSQGAGLTLSNSRVTFGELGAARPDAKLLPGDIFFVAFDMEGISVDESGRVKYSMAMEVTDSAGKNIFKQQPVDREDFLPLGGNKLPARAFTSVGLDQAPGIYSCKVTVSDRSTKSSQTLDQKFEVLPKNFGLVQVYTSGDGKGEIPAPTYGIAGQSLFVHFAVVGFDRDKTTKQPKIDVDMVVFDKANQPTLKKPTTVTIDKDVNEKDTGIPLRFLLPMNRAGEFTVALKATDNLTKKTSTIYLPIQVLQPGAR